MDNYCFFLYQIIIWVIGEIILIFSFICKIEYDLQDTKPNINTAPMMA